MITNWVGIKTADGTCDSYVAYPSEGRKLPLVILYMDAIGLRPQIYSMAQKIADQGYFVIAPNIFYRSSPAPIVDYAKLLTPEGMPELFKQVMAMASQLTPALARKDAEAHFEYARQQKGVDAETVGCAGYCMGGAIAIRTAAFFPDQVKAVGSFHAGRLGSDLPTSPHLLAKDIRARLYLAHADHDKSMPAEQIEVIEQALRSAGLRFTSEVYRNAEHGFTMNDLPAYDAEADAKHRRNLFALFATELKGRAIL